MCDDSRSGFTAFLSSLKKGAGALVVTVMTVTVNNGIYRGVGDRSQVFQNPPSHAGIRACVNLYKTLFGLKGKSVADSADDMNTGMNGSHFLLLFQDKPLISI